MPRESPNEKVDRLTSLLARFEREGRLGDLVVKGVISTQRLSDLTGFRYSVLYQSRLLRPIVEAYTEKVRALGFKNSRFDLAGEKVRGFLTERIASGELNVTWLPDRPIVNRSWLLSELDLTDTALRNAEVQKVLREFDQRIDPTAYPKGASIYDKYVPALRKIVFDPNPPQYRQRLNKLAIARQLKINPIYLDCVPALAAVIREGKNQIASSFGHARQVELPDGTIDESVTFLGRSNTHGRNFCFLEFAPSLGDDLTLLITSAFLRASELWATATAKPRYLALCKFLRFLIATEAPSHGSVLSDSERLRNSLSAWRKSLLDERVRKPTTRSRELKDLNAALRALSSAGISPHLKSARTLRRNQSSAVRRPSLANIPEGLRMRDLLQSDGMTLDDAARFLQTIEEERLRDDNLPRDHILAIEAILVRRLERIRAAAQRTFSQGVALYREGVALSSTSEIPGSAISEALSSLPSRANDRAAVFSRIFPPGNPSQAKARFLVYLRHEFGAQIPRAGIHPTFGQFFRKRYAQYGGFNLFDAYVRPRDEMLVAAVVLYLVESGANLSTARELFTDCQEASTRSGYVRITGFKSRAGGKPIIEDLAEPPHSESINAIMAIRTVLNASALLRRFAPPGLRRSLFIRRSKNGSITVLPEERCTLLFRMIMQEEPYPNHDILPCMIRSSVLLLHNIRHDGDIGATQTKAKHTSPDETVRYVSYVSQCLAERKIRRFQDHLEALVTIPLSSAARLLQISEKSLEQNLRSAMESGLGALLPAIELQTHDSPAIVVICEAPRIAEMLVTYERLTHEISASQNNHSTAIAIIQLVIDALSRGPEIAVLDDARRLCRLRRVGSQ